MFLSQASKQRFNEEAFWSLLVNAGHTSATRLHASPKHFSCRKFLPERVTKTKIAIIT